MIKIQVNELFFSPNGTSRVYNIEVPDQGDQEVTIQPNQKIHFDGLKIEDGICFIVTPQKLKISYICNRCLRKVERDIKLRTFEKQYYLQLPADIEEDLADFINPKTYEIDITELMREAIFLSLPVVLTCESKCPGLPQIKHEKDVVETEKQMPFKGLKELLKAKK